MEDAELLHEYTNGNSDSAFRTLVERYTGVVLSAALRQTGDHQLAEDVTQTVFITLARKAPRLKREAVLVGWLYRTTRLVALQAMRNEARRFRREQTAVELESLREDESGSQTVWDHIAPVLDEAMCRLSTKDRDALLLRFFQGLSLRQVGDSLGCTEQAAKKRVNRALERLRSRCQRRGLAVVTTALAAGIASRAVQAAPEAVVQAVGAVSIAKGATASASVIELTKITMKTILWKTISKCIGIAAVGVVLIGVSLTRAEQPGVVDPSFQSMFLSDGGGDSIQQAALQSDGKVLVAGLFIQGIENVPYAWQGNARLNSNGAVDMDFRPPIQAQPHTVAVQNDGKIVVAGANQLQVQPHSADLWRLNPDGTLDGSFPPPEIPIVQQSINKLLVQKDGKKLIVAGQFNSLRGEKIHAIARLNSDGTLDQTFLPNTSTNEIISDVVLQSDGKLVAWSMGAVGLGMPYNPRGLIRLNGDGSLDTSYRPDKRLTIPIALQDNGQLLATIRTNGNARLSQILVRLNQDGSTDTTFNAVASRPGKTPWPLGAIAVQPNGRVLIGGSFMEVNGIARNGIARLNSDGSIDSTFYVGTGLEATNTTVQVNSIVLQPDGKILIAGLFRKCNGTPAYDIVRLFGDPPFAFSSAATVANGVFNVALDCAGIQTVHIEASDNLRDWSRVSTITNQEAVVGYSQPMNGSVRKFIRAVADPQ